MPITNQIAKPLKSSSGLGVLEVSISARKKSRGRLPTSSTMWVFNLRYWGKKKCVQEILHDGPEMNFYFK